LSGAEATLYSRKNLEEIASETSEAERRANGAERELMDWKTLNSWRSTSRRIRWVNHFRAEVRLFVELFEVFVEGLLPIGALEEFAGARCAIRERDHAIVALQGGGAAAEPPDAPKPRRKTPPLEWHLGDKVRVRAERIDPMRKRVEFALVEKN